MTAPRCDVAPWLLPRERDPDEREEEGQDMCDDETGSDDCGDGFAGRGAL